MVSLSPATKEHGLLRSRPCAIQFLFDVGLLHGRLRCKECYADLSLKDYLKKNVSSIFMWKIYPFPNLALNLDYVVQTSNFPSVRILLFHRQHGHFPRTTKPVTTHVTMNNIESSWRSLWHRLSREGILQKQMDSHIVEHLWFMDCTNCDAEPFHELIQDIKTVYPVQYLSSLYNACVNIVFEFFV